MREPEQNQKQSKSFVPFIPPKLAEYGTHLYEKLHELDIKLTQKIYRTTKQYRALLFASKVIKVISNGPALPLFILLYGLGNNEGTLSFVVYVIFLVMFHEFTIKGFFHRERPNTAGNQVGLSFPSSHSFASGIIMIITIFFDIPFKAAIIIFTLLNAINRPAIGVHYVADVIAGLTLGILSGGGWILILRIAEGALP